MGGCESVEGVGGVVKDVCIYRMSLSQSSGWKCFRVKCDRQEYNCLHHLVKFIHWLIFFWLPSLHGNN